VVSVVKIAVNASRTCDGTSMWKNDKPEVKAHIRITELDDPIAAPPVAAITLLLGALVCWVPDSTEVGGNT